HVRPKISSKERGGSSPLQGIILRIILQNFGDLIYLMNGDSSLKSSTLHSPPSICFNKNHRRVDDKPLIK
ncbi:hypothetical protein Ccrd_022105, partial [Cynara cardunculus var. scolymus]